MALRRKWQRRVNSYNTTDLSCWDMYRALPIETRTYLRKHLKGLPRWDKEVEIETNYIDFFGYTYIPYEKDEPLV
jgi:hypothetical protein